MCLIFKLDNMSDVINVAIKERLEKIYSEVFEFFGSKEFKDEKDKCEKLWYSNDVELSEEEEEYCMLFDLENLKDFIREMDR